MSRWPTVNLEDLAAPEKSAISKPYGSAIVKEDYVASGVPVVRGVNLAEGRFHDSDFVFISEEIANRMPGARLRPGDLVFTHRGSVGQVSMIPRAPMYNRYAVSTSQVKARLDETKASPEFYYYWFRSPAGQHTILQSISTVGVPGLVQPVATVKALEVPFPQLGEQRAIASVLGVLDDKIESNRRSLALCFELARARFNEIAAGADMARLGDVATLVLGGTPSKSTAAYWANGDVPWINSGTANQDIILEPTAYITEAALERSAAKMMPAGASVIAITGATLGQVALLGIPTSGNQSLVGVWADSKLLTAWLHFAVQAVMADLIKTATGAAQQHVNKGNIADLSVPVVDGDDLAAWATTAMPLVDRARQLASEVGRLTMIWDALLPALFSGSIRVPMQATA